MNTTNTRIKQMEQASSHASLSQRIQLMVWEYIRCNKYKRYGAELADKIIEEVKSETIKELELPHKSHCSVCDRGRASFEQMKEDALAKIGIIKNVVPTTNEPEISNQLVVKYNTITPGICPMCGTDMNQGGGGVE